MIIRVAASYFCIMTLTSYCARASASFIPSSFQAHRGWRLCSRVFSSSSDVSDKKAPEEFRNPWESPEVGEKLSKRKSHRFRQHVNPLAGQYQQPTVLSNEWPLDVFHNCNKSLHLDIGCGKGGFLIDTVISATEEHGSDQLPFNYLGLEIRPGVVRYAKGRIELHGGTGALEFLGCNANVDLGRVLQRYHDACESEQLLHLVSIQYPDPHFKSQHAKRRVVTSHLIDSLAKFMPTDAQVFLQSDIQSVLDDMRLKFRENTRYFTDTAESADEYLEDNPLGVPTEREDSVLKKGLPVYRSLFTRTSESHEESTATPAAENNEPPSAGSED
jgi:tRNA (guanine-N7-)-methyltransferase